MTTLLDTLEALADHCANKGDYKGEGLLRQCGGHLVHVLHDAMESGDTEVAGLINGEHMLATILSDIHSEIARLATRTIGGTK